MAKSGISNGNSRWQRIKRSASRRPVGCLVRGDDYRSGFQKWVRKKGAWTEPPDDTPLVRAWAWQDGNDSVPPPSRKRIKTICGCRDCIEPSHLRCY